MSTTNATLDFRQVSDPPDIAIVAELAGPIWRETFTPIIGPEQVEFMLADWQSPQAITAQIQQGAEYYIAHIENLNIGYCAWSPEPEPKAKISKFYISSQYHGAGFAQTMMQFLENKATQAGCHTLWLQVNRKNHRAIRFYRKTGFIIVRDLYKKIGPGFYIDDHVMEKTLPTFGALAQESNQPNA